MRENKEQTRSELGKRAGRLGILCNTALSAGKIAVGSMVGSTSIVADGMNNLSDAASSVVEYFGRRIAYINVMANMSVDCDCCAKAEDPCMKDMGILASLDPVAIDCACLDLVKNSDDPGKDHLLQRINSLNGTLTPKAAEALGMGTSDYELIVID